MCRSYRALEQPPCRNFVRQTRRLLAGAASELRNIPCHLSGIPHSEYPAPWGDRMQHVMRARYGACASCSGEPAAQRLVHSRGGAYGNHKGNTSGACRPRALRIAAANDLRTRSRVRRSVLRHVAVAARLQPASADVVAGHRRVREGQSADHPDRSAGPEEGEVKVEVADGYLTISGERKTEKEEKKENEYRC